MDCLTYSVLLCIQALCLGASNVTLEKTLLGTDPIRHELLCSWLFEPTDFAIFRKNQLETFKDIVFISNDCTFIPSTFPNGMTCGCINSTLARCNITQTLDSDNVEEWMCVVPYQGRKQNSNVIPIIYTELRTSLMQANDHGTTTKTHPATVTSFYINEMQEEFKVTLIESGNGSINCVGDGKPKPTLALIKHSAEDEHNTTLYTVNSTHLRYNTSLGSQHSGQYTCVSSNRYGKDYRTIHLIIKTLEDIGNIMQWSSVTPTETAVRLQWTLHDNTLMHLVDNSTCYVVYKTKGETEWTNIIKELNKTVTQTTLILDLQLNNLRPHTQYEVQLIAQLPSANYAIAPIVMFKTLSCKYGVSVRVYRLIDY
ncbi:hypothetical protein DPMN_160377 [Dreissena polymorpha]|uniref:Ig-like domain-containing protein n=1 Tax=Dreissena polymorpha TaxID=45954 RepID=A0A9D4ISH1_DREPO|nr:hypothetical protein DPMN_160377 [Dreissena polymorpha]